MRRSRWEHLGRDQLLARPDARQWIEAIRQRLAKDDDVRLDIEVLDRPELARAVEPHLNFVVDEEDATLVEDLLERREVAARRYDVTTGALNGFDIKRGKLWFLRLGIPERVVFGVEVLRELLDAVEIAVLPLLVVRTTEAVRIRDEVRAIREVPVATPIPIAGRDGRGPQRPSVIPAHERKHQILAGRIADDLQRILNRLRAADVEMNAPLAAELRLVEPRERGGQLHFLRMEVLTRQLRQRVELFLQ